MRDIRLELHTDEGTFVARLDLPDTATVRQATITENGVVCVMVGTRSLLPAKKS